MLFTDSFVFLAALVSMISAAPSKRDTCNIQRLSGLSVVASADTSNKVRFDMYTVSSGLIQEGDIVWQHSDGPNGNEKFTATVGSQPNLFTFHRKDAEAVGVSGTHLLRSDTAATFKVTCGGCNDFAGGNEVAATDCTFEHVDGATNNGTGQCITFQAAYSVVQMQQCQNGNPGQVLAIYSAA